MAERVNDNPQPGEVWEHRDRGSIYVLARGGTQVRVQRRPFGDSQARPWWQRLDNFHRSITGRLHDARQNGGKGRG